jgi:O-antigen/teichoic acid export membrane protein
MVEKVTNRTERAVKGTLVSFLQYGLQVLLQAFLAPLVLRMAGQETLGAYALLMQIIGYLAMIDMGFSVTMNRYLAHANGIDDNGRRFCEVLSTARTFLLGSNILFSALVLVVAYYLDVWVSTSPSTAVQARHGLMMLAAWGIVRTPWSIYSAGLNATQNLVAANFIGILGNVSRLILSLTLLYAGFGLFGLMLANIISEFLSVAVSTAKFRRLYPSYRPVWGLPDKHLFREMLRFGSQAFLMNIAWRLVSYTDNIVAGYLYGAAAVSVYYVTQMPSTMGALIVNRVPDNVAPAINELYVQKDYIKLRSVFIRLHRATMLLVMPLFGGIIMLNRQMIELWVGIRQYAGASMTCALAIFAVLITVGHVNDTFIFASGKIRPMSIVSLLQGIANLALSLWLGKVLGLSGIMWASVIANIPATIYIFRIAMKQLHINYSEYLRVCALPTVVPLVLGTVVSYLVYRVIPAFGWVSFLLQAVTLIVVYVGSVYRLSLMPDERSWINAKMFRLKNPLPQ